MRPGRIEKTLQRNLTDLDTHLYFLREEFSKIIGGDTAYIKKISNTLRNLICVSDKTEGLLWRIAEALEAGDYVEIHAVRGIDKEHWLAKRVDFTLIPFWKPSDKNFPFDLVKVSLKKFIKECEAIYANKKSYTHEQLIKLISQQMGSSHEAEGVDPFLVRLSGMSFSDQPALVNFLLAHADLTLDIGEKILLIAEEKTEFKRKKRPEIIIPNRVVEKFSFMEDENFHGRDEIKSDYTWGVIVRAPHIGWETDGRAHNFGISTLERMYCSIEKPTDGWLEVKLYTSTNVLIKRQSINSTGKLDVSIFIIQKDGSKSIKIGNSLPRPSNY